MDMITNLRTFLAVASHGSFASAARHLHVVPSVVAKRIAQLEKSVGSRLFERSTRTITITDAGQRLLPRVRHSLMEFEELLKDARRDDGKLEGHLRLMLPTTLSMAHLSNAIVEFMRVHDRITVETVLADRSVSPLEEDVDIMVSGRLAHYDGVSQVPLAPTNVLLCASPEYLAKAPPIDHPSDLVDHTCLIFSPQGTTWAFESERGPLYVDVQARLASDDNHTLSRGVERGLGISVLPRYIARKGLDAGTIVPLLEHFPPQDRWYKAYIPRRKERLARVEAMCEWLRLAIEQLNALGACNPIFGHCD
ncbi:LysR family transcriptional regulator [Marinobacterium lutimaris]|uniref:Transcriptional regulator, LysR family n=1 Tax=Marinobacterium lutimaris TaxID=568106 RepID=A0A1H6DKG7_9GAMM|nr:LysR family transcriptional regulator [Marinobacterium lutimaris]SEG85704.1 transcriptional regulator, LysR family [Marinobacterium lutimaris]